MATAVPPWSGAAAVCTRPMPEPCAVTVPAPEAEIAGNGAGGAEVRLGGRKLDTLCIGLSVRRRRGHLPAGRGLQRNRKGVALGDRVGCGGGDRLLPFDQPIALAGRVGALPAAGGDTNGHRRGYVVVTDELERHIAAKASRSGDLDIELGDAHQAGRHTLPGVRAEPLVVRHNEVEHNGYEVMRGRQWRERGRRAIRRWHRGSDIYVPEARPIDGYVASRLGAVRG